MKLDGVANNRGRNVVARELDVQIGPRHAQPTYNLASDLSHVDHGSLRLSSARQLCQTCG